MDLDVCFQLDDPPSAKLKKASAKAAQFPPIAAKQAPEKPIALSHLPEILPAMTNASFHHPVMPASFLSGIPTSKETGAGLGRSGVFDGSGPTGAMIDFFHVGVRAASVVYVIDRSTSMGLRGALDIAKRELLASLQRLAADTRFQIIIYNRHAECLRIGGRTDLVPATPENKQEVASLLQSVRPEGSTDPLPALRQALALRPEVIFFLTDADDLNVRQISDLTQFNRGRTAIHAIELNALHRDRHDQPLQLLARNNHGEYRAVSVGGP
jgi:hypothetical protein